MHPLAFVALCFAAGALFALAMTILLTVTQ